MNDVYKAILDARAGLVPEGIRLEAREADPVFLQKRMTARFADDFENDIQNPYAPARGFSTYGVFAYITPLSGLLGWLREHPASAPSLPAPGDFRRIIDSDEGLHEKVRLVMAYRAAARGADVDSEIAKVLAKAEKECSEVAAIALAVAGKAGNDPHVMDRIFERGLDPLVARERNDAARKFLENAGFLDTDGLFHGAKEICALAVEIGRHFEMTEEGPRLRGDTELADLVLAADSTVQGMNRFIAASVRTHGGAVRAAEIVKERLAREFGAPEPAAFRFVGESLLLIHARDLRKGADPGKVMDRDARIVGDSMAVVAMEGDRELWRIDIPGGKPSRDVAAEIDKRLGLHHADEIGEKNMKIGF